MNVPTRVCTVALLQVRTAQRSCFLGTQAEPRQRRSWVQDASRESPDATGGEHSRATRVGQGEVCGVITSPAAGSSDRPELKMCVIDNVFMYAQVGCCTCGALTVCDPSWWNGHLSVELLRYHVAGRAELGKLGLLLRDDFSGRWTRESSILRSASRSSYCVFRHVRHPSPRKQILRGTSNRRRTCEHRGSQTCESSSNSDTPFGRLSSYLPLDCSCVSGYAVRGPLYLLYFRLFKWASGVPTLALEWRLSTASLSTASLSTSSKVSILQAILSAWMMAYNLSGGSLLFFPFLFKFGRTAFFT